MSIATAPRHLDRERKFNRTANQLLAAPLIGAVALPVLAPVLSAGMSEHNYEVMILVASTVGFAQVILALVYHALSVGHRLRNAIAYASAFLLFMLVVGTPPVSEFIFRFIVGGLAAAVR